MNQHGSRAASTEAGESAGSTDLGSPRESGGPASRLALLTNRNHLSEFLASGMVAPGIAIPEESYYADLGLPDLPVIPLLLRDPSPAMADYVARASATAYPVLIDLALGPRSGSRAVGVDYTVTSYAEQESPLLELLPGVVPLSAIEAVHFRSEEELREFGRLAYTDIRLDAVSLHASPERFQGSDIDLLQLQRALEEARAGIEPPRIELLASLSALSGAL